MNEENPAKPAQSDAPSAERFEKFLYGRLGFAFKAQNSSLTVTVFKPFKVMSLSQSDHKWDVVYLMDKAWELLLELAAKVAQLERELRDSRIAELHTHDRACHAEDRSETAEAALSEAREKAIQMCVEVVEAVNKESRISDESKMILALATLRALLAGASGAADALRVPQQLKETPENFKGEDNG